MSSLEQKHRFRLVGRDAEMALLASTLGRVVEGGTAVAVLGEPGIGKTRMATELTDRARADGIPVAWGRAWETGGAPAFWPWTQVLRSLREQVGDEPFIAACSDSMDLVGRILPELTGANAASSAADRFSLMDAVSSTIRRLSRVQASAIVIDDLHAADDDSVQMVDFLVRGLTSDDHLLVVIGVQAPGKFAHLEPVLGTFTREHETVSLERLNIDAIGELYSDAMGSRPASGILETVMEASEGNPFFAIEMMKVLQTKEGPYRPDDSRGFRVPRGVRELLGRRISDVSDETRMVLSVGAVLGREFNVSTVAGALAMATDPVLKAMEEAVASGIVTEISSLGRFSFSHVLMREVCYEDLSVSDRMRLHAQVAKTLERRYGRDIDHHIDEIAHHYFKAAQAGDKEKTLDFSLRAAQRAMSRMAYEEAIRLYDRALKVAELGGISGGRRSRISSELKRARQLAVESDPAAAPISSTANRFFLEGDYWTIAFDTENIRLRDSKGMHYLVQLLKNPGRELHALELVGLAAGSGGGDKAREGDELALEHGELGAIIDPEARAAYKARLDDLKDDLQAARDFKDDERAARAQMEIEALTEHLATATGFGGRTRKAVAEGERARTSVTKAIKGAVNRIADASEPLGRHLKATVRTGAYCSYSPDDRVPIVWETR